MPALENDDDTETERDLRRTVVAASVGDERLEAGAHVGRFIVLECIGAGGMGSVYAAWDPQLNRRVALKVVHGVKAGGAAFEAERARMLREARALAQLTHQNVVRVYELGEIEGAPFIAMELVEGQSLKDLLSRRRRKRSGGDELTHERVVEILLEAARGLAAVHKLGIVHRDFKPANVFVGVDGRVCIGDFGLAVSSDGAKKDDSSARGDGSDDWGDSDDSATGQTPATASAMASIEDQTVPQLGGHDVTAKGVVAGTPAFMAPEQLAGEPLDARCDQFAFCVSMWLALFGERPFKSNLAAMTKAPSTPSSSSSASSLAFAPVLTRGLAGAREKRFDDMSALVAALEAAHARPRRRRIVAASVGAAVVVVALASAAAWQAAHRDPCGVRARAATLVTDVDGVARAHLDSYRARWTAAADTACFGDVVRRPAIDACLGRRLGDASALARMLAAHSDVDAVPAVLALPTPASCLLEKGAARTSDATLVADLARARASWLAGRPSEARTLAHDVVVAAGENAPIAAEALTLEGDAAADTGDFEGARASLQSAIAAAMRAGDATWEAAAWADLLHVVGDKARKFDDAALLRPFVRAAVARVPDDVEVTAKARLAEALLENGLGHSDEGAVLAREAIASAEKRVPRDPRFVSRAHNVLGILLATRGDVRAAIDEMKKARKELETALPPGHVSFGAVDNNTGLQYERIGDYESAEASFKSALAIFEKQSTPENPTPTLASPLNNLGDLARLRGKGDEARAYYTRALAVNTKTVGAEHERTTYSTIGLALVDEDDGKYDEAKALLDDVTAVRTRANPHGLLVLDVLAARAALALEMHDAAAARAALQAARDADDGDRRAAGVAADGSRAELAVAALVLDRKDTRALDVATKNAARVAWPGFDAVVDVARAPKPAPEACAKLPRVHAIARVVAARCAKLAP